VPQALWLLMKLRLFGWGRRWLRNVKTVKGAILTVIFGFFTVGWLALMVFNAILAPAGTVTRIPADQVNRYAPLVLLAYCVGMLGFGRGQTPLSFTLPEVQFLFSAPFSRRQLLTFKLVAQLLMTLPAALIFAFIGRSFAGMFLSGLFALMLILMFLQFFAIALAMISCTIEEVAYTRLRRLALLGVVALIAAAAIVGWRARAADDPLETLLRIESSDVFQYGLMPLRWFVQTMTATSIDGRFLGSAAGAIGVNLVLLVLIYALDGRYLEAAARSAEVRYTRLEKLRSGGLAGFSSGPAKAVKYRTPDPPSLGGIGPIAWRQFIAAVRSRRVLGVLLFVTLMASIGPIVAGVMNKGAMDESLPWILAGMGLMMSVMMSQTLAFDFRSDIDRMEVLKTLPIPAWRIVVGQLLVPVVCTSVYQIALTTLVYLILGHIGILLAITVLMSWPVNLLLLGIDNLLFLLFPTRMAAANPGDFSNAGRQMIVTLGKLMGMAIGVGIPVALGAITFAVTDNWPLTIAAGFFPSLVTCALPIPLVTMAFQRFDVARDTPP